MVRRLQRLVRGGLQLPKLFAVGGQPWPQDLTHLPGIGVALESDPVRDRGDHGVRERTLCGRDLAGLRRPRIVAGHASGQGDVLARIRFPRPPHAQVRRGQAGVELEHMATGGQRRFACPVAQVIGMLPARAVPARNHGLGVVLVDEQDPEVIAVAFRRELVVAGLRHLNLGAHDGHPAIR